MLGGTAELGLISSFGVDADGELYIVSYSRGRILKIVPRRYRDLSGTAQDQARYTAVPIPDR